MTIINADTCHAVPIGRRGENLVTEVRFSIAAWREEFGAGTVQLLVQRNGDAAPYQAVIVADGDTVHWPITATDTGSAGYGNAELRYIVGDQLAISQTYLFFVAPSLADTDAPPPDPWETWVEVLSQAGAAAEAAAEAAADSAAEALSYASAAETAANTATSKADEASGSAENAADSASDAASSASAAADSASGASAAQTAAEAAQEAAEAAEASAAASASNATEKSEEASNSATDASTAKTAAQTAAEAATDQATAAAGSATSAAGSAATASTKATEASASAAAAQTAQTAAETAQAAAEEAAEAAQEAAEAAEHAAETLGGTSGVVAPAFSAGAAYSAGKLVIYDKMLYRAKVDVAAGEWDAAKWEQTTMDAELSAAVGGVETAINAIRGVTA